MVRNTRAVLKPKHVIVYFVKVLFVHRQTTIMYNASISKVNVKFSKNTDAVIVYYSKMYF